MSLLKFLLQRTSLHPFLDIQLAFTNPYKQMTSDVLSRLLDPGTKQKGGIHNSLGQGHFEKEIILSNQKV